MATEVVSTGESKSEAKIVLDNLASLLYGSLGMRPGQFIGQMYRRLKHDKGRVSELEKKMAKLSPAYNKYLDAQRQLHEHERSIENLMTVIGPNIMYPSGPQDEHELEELDKVQDLRRELELWEAVQQYLRFVPEAKVRDILDFLGIVDIASTRQAVEACIKARPKVFAVRKRKRERFVSLKNPY
jgi:hypothetical protein